MLKLKKALGVFLIITLILILGIQVSCFAQSSDAQSGDEIIGDTRQMLEAISLGEQDKIAEMVTEDVKSGLSAEVVTQMRDYLKGTVQDIAVSDVAFSTLNAQDGTPLETRSADVVVTTDQDEYHINVTQINQDGNWQFHVFNLINSSDYAAVTQVENDQSRMMQGVMVAVTVIFYAVIAWAIVACIRAKIKMKWLWIILIILLCICITVASNGAGVVRATVSFNIYIASFSSAYYFMNGGYQLNFILPVGAVLFLALKRKLEKNYREKLAAEQHTMSEAAAFGREEEENGQTK